jgi:hypothetical protein
LGTDKGSALRKYRDFITYILFRVFFPHHTIFFNNPVIKNLDNPGDWTRGYLTPGERGLRQKPVSRFCKYQSVTPGGGVAARLSRGMVSMTRGCTRNFFHSKAFQILLRCIWCIYFFANKLFCWQAICLEGGSAFKQRRAIIAIIQSLFFAALNTKFNNRRKTC